MPDPAAPTPSPIDDRLTAAPASTQPTGKEGEARRSSGWRLVTPEPQHAALVAGWPRSAREAGQWVSRPQHPFPASEVTAWWSSPDVQPFLLVDLDGIPAAYGELWDDQEEDEVELARLIVDPGRRREGVGRRLVNELVSLAKTSGRATCFLRVAPGNDAALALYRSAGFRDVDPDLATEWNRQQPTAYVWLVHQP